MEKQIVTTTTECSDLKLKIEKTLSDILSDKYESKITIRF